jgi:hypothetical protein
MGHLYPARSEFSMVALGSGHVLVLGGTDGTAVPRVCLLPSGETSASRS